MFASTSTSVLISSLSAILLQTGMLNIYMIQFQCAEIDGVDINQRL